MAQFISRMFTPPSKKTWGQPGQAQRSIGAPAALGTRRAKKRTQTKYAGTRQQDEAETAKKMLLGQ